MDVEWPDLFLKDIGFHGRIGGYHCIRLTLRVCLEDDEGNIVPIVSIHTASQDRTPFAQTVMPATAVFRQSMVGLLIVRPVARRFPPSVEITAKTDQHHVSMNLFLVRLTI